MLCSLLIVATATFPSTPKAASNWYVDDDATGPGTGTLTDPFPTIQGALDATTTQSGDTLLVLEGTYDDPFVIDGLPLDIIAAPGTGDVNLIRTDANTTLVTIRNVGTSQVRLQGLEISSSSLHGGAGRLISIEGSRVTLEDCSIRATSTNADSGALKAFAGSDVTMRSCLVTDNQGGEHSSGLSFFASDATIEDCEFRDNPGTSYSFQGGAIYFSGSIQDHLLVTDTLFTGNNSYDGSGAKINGSAEATFRACQFVDNGDGFNNQFGGALSGSGTVERCTFRSNTARNGGAIYGEWTISDSVFEGNTGADGEDHATAVQGLGDTQLIRCILRGHWGTTLDPFRADSSVVNATVTECVFEGNGTYRTDASQAQSGGAITDCVAIGCRFEGNSATSAPSPSAGASRGGAAVNSTLIRCVLLDNEADEGGAVYNCALHSCTLVGNGAAIAGAALDSDLNSCIATDSGSAPVVGGTAVYSNVEGGFVGTGNISTPPLFWGPASRDLELTALSPCIDTGDPFETDPDGSRRDMGAHPFDSTYVGTPRSFCPTGGDGAGCTPSLAANTAPSLSQGYDVVARGMRDSSLAIVFLGTQYQAVPYLNGQLCLGGPMRRGPMGVFTAGVSACDHTQTFPIAAGTLQSTGLQPGSSLYAQVLYRDSLGGTPSVGITGALEAILRP